MKQISGGHKSLATLLEIFLTISLLFDETLRHIQKSFSIASLVKYSKIRQNLSNSAIAAMARDINALFYWCPKSFSVRGAILACAKPILYC